MLARHRQLKLYTVDSTGIFPLRGNSHRRFHNRWSAGCLLCGRPTIQQSVQTEKEAAAQSPQDVSLTGTKSEQQPQDTQSARTEQPFPLRGNSHRRFHNRWSAGCLLCGRHSTEVWIFQGIVDRHSS